MSIHTHHLRVSLTLFALIATAGIVHATPPSVTAMLSNSEPAVNEAVQLQIKVNGAQRANVPHEISIDGLEIHQTGTSQQFEMRNFDVSSSVVYTYTILPLRAGKFKIPPQTIRVGNESLSTPELTLNVTSGSNGSAGSSQSGRTAAGLASKLAFAELVVAKKDAYVGEMVPAEIRLGFDPRAHPQLQEGPELSGQGFTIQKLQQPSETMETIGGRTYQVYTFKTAISPARTGKFEIGPVQAKAIVLLPRRPSAPRSRPRSAFDLFNLDDPFSDPFFSDPFGSLGERTELPIKSDAVTLSVKPLPPNAPPNFSGSIGTFTMAVDAKPKNVQVGDPITVTATISGRGNFDRMNGPTLEDERGWHKYPPSSRFKQDDDVGISGEKTFETVIAPNEKKAAIPPLTFAYFDPIKEDYDTLRSDPVSIAVEGTPGPAPNVAAAPATSPQSAPTVAGTPASKPADILYQLNDLGQLRSFTPIYERTPFWAVQLAPLIALLGFTGWKIRRAKIGDREAQRVAALQHESAELLRKLRRSEISPQEYFSNASRVARVKTALAKNMDPNAIDAETIAKTFHLDENERARLRTLFERTDELRYSGTGNGDSHLANQDREEVLELLENLRA